MLEKLTKYSRVRIGVEAELGRRTMTVREILSLSPGSVITLPRPVGSKVAVFVGGASFGSGDMMRRGKTSAVRVSSFSAPQGRS
jgi:flagellar motor switch protein FliN/FliY